jgi:hypothetical protein
VCATVSCGMVTLIRSHTGSCAVAAGRALRPPPTYESYTGSVIARTSRALSRSACPSLSPTLTRADDGAGAASAVWNSASSMTRNSASTLRSNEPMRVREPVASAKCRCTGILLQKPATCICWIRCQPRMETHASAPWPVGARDLHSGLVGGALGRQVRAPQPLVAPPDHRSRVRVLVRSRPRPASVHTGGCGAVFQHGDILSHTRVTALALSDGLLMRVRVSEIVAPFALALSDGLLMDVRVSEIVLHTACCCVR